jgi:hypothetical protein
MKADLYNISKTRKVLFTVLGILYALAILGNVYYHYSLLGVLGASIFFGVVTLILLLWIK